MYVLTRGSAWLPTGSGNGSGLALQPGDHVISTSGAPHQLLAHPGCVSRPISEWLSEEFIAHADQAPTALIYAQYELTGLKQNPLAIGLPDIVHLSHHRDRHLSAAAPLVRLYQQTVQEAAPGWQFSASRLAELIFIKTVVAQLIQAGDREPEQGSPDMMLAATDGVVGPALRAMIENPESPWTVPMMARLARTSRSGFSERFRNLVGKPPLQFLTEIRMRKACRLLRESDVEISSIATLVGYESPSSFSHAFKRWHGHSPADFRREVNLK